MASATQITVSGACLFHRFDIYSALQNLGQHTSVGWYRGHGSLRQEKSTAD